MAERRNERSRRAILDAAYQLAVELGYANLTIEAIAARAGVGKQTIYRWWPSKGAVVLEASLELFQHVAGFPDTGDVVADLATQMRAAATMLASEWGQVYRVVIAAVQSDPELGARLRENFLNPIVRNCRTRLAAAQQAGELRADLDLLQVVELLYAPLYYRLLLGTAPLTPDLVDPLLDAAFTGLRNRRASR